MGTEEEESEGHRSREAAGLAMLDILWGGLKPVCSWENAKRSLFLYSYLLIILFPYEQL